MWRVKAGHEDEFVRLWRAGVADLARQLPHASFRLWRDPRDTLRFQSVGGPVESEDALDTIRGSESFRAAMDALEETLESVEVGALELVEEIA